MQERSSRDEDDRFQDAVSWFLRRREAESAEVERDYRSWLAADPAREATMQAVGRFFADLHAPASAVDADGGVQIVPPRSAFGTMRNRWAGFAMAASLVVAAVAGNWVAQEGQYRLRGDTVTATGETRQLLLADGSRIDLAPQSAVRVNFRGQARQVTLDKGEAFFEVAHNPKRPFIVEAGSGQARVLGTAFDVRRFSNRARVSVVRGAVGVRAGEAGGRDDVLAAGQSAWLSESGVRRDEAMEPGEISAWRENRLVFYRAPMPEVVAEMKRFNRGLIIIGSAKANKVLVSGVVEVSDSRRAIATLTQALDLKTTQLGQWVTIIY